MRFDPTHRSRNIEDRRGMRVGGPVGGVGLGTVAIVLVVSFLTGQNPLQLLQLVSDGGGGASAPVEVPAGLRDDDPQAVFIGNALDDTEQTWTQLFAERGSRYQAPVLVLFEQAVQSGCGTASSAVGPFYCPADRKVYLDLSFFRELDQRFGAPGDFAQAYVVAHEVGHHIQTVTGVSSRVNRMQQGLSEREANALSVRQELQADCFAGVWGHHARSRNLLEEGDVEEGLQAAAAIGDDRLQRRAGGTISPESFTHGTSEQRVEWLRRGLTSGEVEACDTFEGRL